MDVIIVIGILIFGFIASSYLYALSRVEWLKKNWVEYRCNPIYMPVAGLVGQNVSDNFMKCTMTMFHNYAGFIMDPLMAEFSIVNDTLEEIGGTMSSMRSMMSGVRGGFLGIVGSVFGKIHNLMSQIQYIIIRMRTLLGRVIGTMMTFVYIFSTGKDSAESVVNGPIVKAMSYF
jgi:hypothetical protein